MAHARQQIRDAVATALGSIDEVGDNVYTSHVYPVDRLPALVITTPSETYLEEASAMGDDQAFLLDLEVRVLAKAESDTVDDLLDTIAAKVQAALAADDTLGGRVLNLITTETEVEIDAEGEQPIGVATTTWSCIYRIDPADPETLTH